MARRLPAFVLKTPSSSAEKDKAGGNVEKLEVEESGERYKKQKKGRRLVGELEKKTCFGREGIG